MKLIDETRLEQDVAYRFSYVSEFIGLSGRDIDVIHAAAEFLAPHVTSLVDAVYVKLFTYDCTKRHFVPRQHGFNGKTPVSLEELTLDHEQIQFRKQHLTNYLVKLVTAPYDEKLVAYLDLVGKMHTPDFGNPNINVPLVQMNALMGFVSDAISATIFSLNLERDSQLETVRAFNKLLWIQNDLITRHYARKN